MGDIATIINSIGVILAAWFTYNQYTKNKMTDVKVKQFEADMAAEKKRRSDNCAIVYGELWEVLHELNADRVYVVQPHPLGNESMVSVYFEAKQRGVESMRPRVQNIEMSEIGKFCAELATNKYLKYTDIENEVADRYAKSILSACGTQVAVIRKLSDNTHDWVGSIFCEYTHDCDVDAEAAKEILDNAATSIQFILPEFKN